MEIYILATKLSKATTYILDALRSIAAFLDGIIYGLVSFLYKLFFYISDTQFITNSQIETIYKNFQLLVAIVVMFSIAVSLINYIVNPDNIKGGKTSAGKLVGKIITSFILLLTVNTIFASAYKLQSAIIQNNFVGKLILGQDVASQTDGMGVAFSKSILSMFITDGEGAGQAKANNDNIGSADDMFKMITTGDEFQIIISEYINDKSEDDQYVLKYNALSIVVGVFVGYILITYIVGVAVRVVQLFYLQVIAPIPILLYVLPGGESKLTAWGKQCFITYLDLFIRHMIIYLTMFLCSTILKKGTGGINYPTTEPTELAFLKIAIVIGILLFAKKVPDLIKELFPSSTKASGNFSLKPSSLKEQFKGTAPAVAIGAGVGLVKKFQDNSKKNKDRLKAQQEKAKAELQRQEMLDAIRTGRTTNSGASLTDNESNIDSPLNTPNDMPNTYRPLNTNTTTEPISSGNQYINKEATSEKFSAAKYNTTVNPETGRHVSSTMEKEINENYTKSEAGIYVPNVSNSTRETPKPSLERNTTSESRKNEPLSPPEQAVNNNNNQPKNSNFVESHKAEYLEMKQELGENNPEVTKLRDEMKKNGYKE